MDEYGNKSMTIPLPLLLQSRGHFSREICIFYLSPSNRPLLPVIIFTELNL